MASNLEINPKHPAVLKLKGMVAAERDSPATKDFASLVFDVAAVSSGYEIKDTAAFATRVISLMSSSSGVDMVAWLADAETSAKAKPSASASASESESESEPAEPEAAGFTTESAPNVVEAPATEGTEDIEIVTPEQGVESWYDSGERLYGGERSTADGHGTASCRAPDVHAHGTYKVQG